MIDKHSHVPIYHQLEEEIKKLIHANSLQAGDLIPSEREFSESYEISRMTVRQAINNLTNEGILEKKRGKGTFVAEQKLTQSLQGLSSFSEEMKQRGMEPSSQVIGFRKMPAEKEVAKCLGLGESDQVYEIKRIRFADQVPMAFEISYMPVNLLPKLTKEHAVGSVYGYVEQETQHAIQKATQSIEASLASKEEADIFGIRERDPILLFHRYGYLDNQVSFEYVKSVYRADRYTFFIDMFRGDS